MQCCTKPTSCIKLVSTQRAEIHLSELISAAYWCRHSAQTFASGWKDPHEKVNNVCPRSSTKQDITTGIVAKAIHHSLHMCLSAVVGYSQQLICIFNVSCNYFASFKCADALCFYKSSCGQLVVDGAGWGHGRAGAIPPPVGWHSLAMHAVGLEAVAAFVDEAGVTVRV